MPTTSKTVSRAEKSSSSSRPYPYESGKGLELVTGIAIFGIVLAILILVLDIWRDNSLHSRITELERQVVNYSKELTTEKYNLSSEIDAARDEFKGNRENVVEENEQNKAVENLNSIADCLKNKKYWRYEQCFK